MLLAGLVVLMLSMCAGLEVGVPERYLRPRNFNPHPYYESVETSVQNSLPEQHPYALFRRPDTRGLDSNGPVQFPKVPEVARAPEPSSRVVQSHQPLVSKNYAFSYSVRDRGSGDDFSHSQAHSGSATKGEYRVKLPDGRVQVVSYTADDTGYRADVRYDNELIDHSYPPKTAYKVHAGLKSVIKGHVRPIYKTGYYLPRAKPIHEHYPDTRPEYNVAEPRGFVSPSTPAPPTYPSPSPPPYETAHDNGVSAPAYNGPVTGYVEGAVPASAPGYVGAAVPASAPGYITVNAQHIRGYSPSSGPAYINVVTASPTYVKQATSYVNEVTPAARNYAAPSSAPDYDYDYVTSAYVGHTTPAPAYLARSTPAPSYTSPAQTYDDGYVTATTPAPKIYLIKQYH